MKLEDFIDKVIGEYKASIKPAKPAEKDEGWLATRDLMALVGMRTMGSAREIADRLVSAGFAERRRISRDRVLFRLSDRFKSWGDAIKAEKATHSEAVPDGWMPLSAIALLLRKTTRGLQYQATEHRISYKVYNTPRPTRYYQVSRFRR